MVYLLLSSFSFSLSVNLSRSDLLDFLVNEDEDNDDGSDAGGTGDGVLEVGALFVAMSAVLDFLARDDLSALVSVSGFLVSTMEMRRM
jgi:hypothetical protein